MAKKLMATNITVCICAIILSIFSCQTPPELQIAYKKAAVRISILGDSYSAFCGYNFPREYSSWYPGEQSEPEFQVTDMWWHILCQENGWALDANNSWSGSTICHTGFDGADYSRKSFASRVHELGLRPNIIFVFGGINDSWANVPQGEYIYSDWSEECLYDFRPALAYVFHHLQCDRPNAAIYFVRNDLITNGFSTSIDEICAHYSVPCIKLHDIEKLSNHPTITGMRQIAYQIKESLRETANAL